MIKKVLAVAAALTLSGCGGKAVMESDMSRMVAASPSSPWLTVEGAGGALLTVTGLEQKARVQLNPDVASVVQARVRTLLQPRYFTDLLINCRELDAKVSAKVNDEAAPPTANLDLAVSCRIVARGPVVSKAYRIRQSATIDPAAPHVDTLVPKLLMAASDDLAEKLWADVPVPAPRR